MVQYQELYKKYRPRVFEEVVGQDNAINQIKTLILFKENRQNSRFFILCIV